MCDTVTLPEAPRELVFCVADLPVLTGLVSLPRRGDRRTGRFNRYYTACADAFERCCRRELLPRAEAACCRAMEDAAPLPHWQAQLCAAVTLQRSRVVSLRCDSAVRGLPYPITSCRGETWDLRRELLLSLPDCFPPHAPWKQMLLRCADEQIAAWEQQGVARYHEDWPQLLRRTFHPHRFYLTEEGLCFFFPADTVAPAVEGIPTFCLPYNEETGPFVPEI